MRACAFAALLALVLTGCSWRNPDFDPTRPHHRPDGFVNSDGSRIEKPLGIVLSWLWQSWRQGLPPPPSETVQGYEGFAVVKPRPAYPRAAPEAATVSWIGHASTLLQIGGLNILTDPQFSQRASFVQWLGPRRKVALPISLDELPPIDVVVISHSHYDHLDRATVQALARRGGPRTLFLVPLGLEPWFHALGIHEVQALDWWQSRTVGEVEIGFVPAHHWSARTLFDRNRSLWGGWVFRSPGFAAYFAGDTGYSADFAEIGRRLGPFDLALLPIGSYAPRWFMGEQHVDPAQAVQMHRDLRSCHSIGVHWGSFELSDEPLDAPVAALAAALDEAGVARSEFELLRHGETRRLDVRNAAAPAPGIRDTGAALENPGRCPHLRVQTHVVADDEPPMISIRARYSSR